MLNIFKSPAFRDSTLGEFKRFRGHWRGTVELGGTVIPLVLVGGRSQPVMPLSSAFTVEFGFTTEWDEEHTLGARFQEGRLVELCGTVVPP
jgi:hypothetical protein